MSRADNVVVVTGAGGFIGGHLVAAFREQGRKHIRAVDSKPFADWYQHFPDVENLQLDLNLRENCEVSAQRARVGRPQGHLLASDMIVQNGRLFCAGPIGAAG